MILEYLLCIYFNIVPINEDWRFNDMPVKYRKQVQLVERNGYYYWKFSHGFYSIPALDKNEKMVKIK